MRCKTLLGTAPFAAPLSRSHGDFSGQLRCRSTTSSVRSTLLGEAGWHRGDFAEPRTLNDALNL
jgi:hypothetical protein